MERFLLIQGLFLDNTDNQRHFQGSIFEKEGVWGGMMVDMFGDSELSEIELTPEKLTFTKIYRHRNDKIFYCLEKDPEKNSVWRGDYDGVETGSNKAICLITE